MKVISFIQNAEIIKKILKHLDLWDLKARPPPRAKAPPQKSESLMYYSDSQLPPLDDYLYIDEQYSEDFLT